MNESVILFIISLVRMTVKASGLFVLVGRLKQFDIAKMNVNWQKVELTCSKGL